MWLEILIPVTLGFLLSAQPAMSANATYASNIGQAEVMYEFQTVDFDWPSEDMKRDYAQDGRYDPTHILISGIKTYKGDVYLSTPRLKYTTGVPSTLNILVNKDGKSVLRPYPSWEMQKIGDCQALQCAMSMEVDPITGLMYVIDPGRAGIFGQNLTQPPPVFCPAKLVVIRLRDGAVVRSHEFPEHLLAKETNYLNDIVLDRGDPSSLSARWVYITDAADSKLIVFDLDTNETRIFQHPSMDADPNEGSDVTVNGRIYKLAVPIDGLAISPDFKYLYYCALGSKDLYQVATSVLRCTYSNFDANVRLVGPKRSQTGGMTYASDNLYYGALNENSVYRWELGRDEQLENVPEAYIHLHTELLVAHDDDRLQWPDSFTVDEYGYLWFTACRAHLFLKGGIDFSGQNGPNYRIWRVLINEKSYLASPDGVTDSVVG